MAMFARRLLQNMLDHLAAHLPLEAREKLARELNRQSSSALGFEWEAALLFGFSHMGKIDYEAPSAQGSRPDMTFVERSETPVRFAWNWQLAEVEFPVNVQGHIHLHRHAHPIAVVEQDLAGFENVDVFMNSGL